MRFLHFLRIVPLSAILFFSCKKETAERQTVNKTIRNTEVFSYTIGAFGDEEDASISKQAAHYTTSVLESDVNRIFTYKYQSVPGFTGTDEVEIMTARGSDGSSPNTNIQYITFKFTITN